MNMKEKLQSLVQNSIVLDISEELEKYEACSTHFGVSPMCQRTSSGRAIKARAIIMSARSAH